MEGGHRGQLLPFCRRRAVSRWPQPSDRRTGWLCCPRRIRPPQAIWYRRVPGLGSRHWWVVALVLPLYGFWGFLVVVEAYGYAQGYGATAIVLTAIYGAYLLAANMWMSRHDIGFIAARGRWPSTAEWSQWRGERARAPEERRATKEAVRGQVPTAKDPGRAEPGPRGPIAQ